MRLVVTDKDGVAVDIPYDLVSVNTDTRLNTIVVSPISNNEDSGGYWETEPYGSREKVNAVFEMLHRAYVDGEKIFGFPMNEEVMIE